MKAAAVPTISVDDLRRAARGIEGVAARTPLVEAADLSRRCGVPVWLKCEQHQPIGAFKIRGAYTAISRLTPDERARGIITHSSGNHAQAVAYAAKHFGIRAVIVMPDSAPEIKIAGTRHHGGEIVFTSRAEREDRAQQLIDREGLVMVAPYDNYDVIVGQGTCALEILDQQPAIETIISPIGGGGMLAGTCAAVGAMKPEVAVWAVEAAASPKLGAALEAGEPVPFEPVDTLADGLVPPSVGQITFGYIRPVVRGAVALTEPEIASGVQYLYESTGLVVEPSGATPAAALITGKISPRGPTALILTGGNIDPDRFRQLVGR